MWHIVVLCIHLALVFMEDCESLLCVNARVCVCVWVILQLFEEVLTACVTCWRFAGVLLVRPVSMQTMFPIWYTNRSVNMTDILWYNRCCFTGAV